MGSATVQISASSYDLLRELARQTGQSMQSLAEEAIAGYRRRLSNNPTAQGATKESSVPVFDEFFAEDPNIIAYKSLSEDFLRDNAGKYAAICNGHLVALAVDKTELLGSVRRKYPGQACLVKRVALKERIVHFRRPRRMFKIEN